MKIDHSLPVVTVEECLVCDLCGFPICPFCWVHYADCPHPGPHSDPDD